jgi:hypothetical protein
MLLAGIVRSVPTAGQWPLGWRAIKLNSRLTREQLLSPAEALFARLA